MKRKKKEENPKEVKKEKTKIMEETETGRRMRKKAAAAAEMQRRKKKTVGATAMAIQKRILSGSETYSHSRFDLPWVKLNNLFFVLKEMSETKDEQQQQLLRKMSLCSLLFYVRVHKEIQENFYPSLYHLYFFLLPKKNNPSLGTVLNREVKIIRNRSVRTPISRAIGFSPGLLSSASSSVRRGSRRQRLAADEEDDLQRFFWDQGNGRRLSNIGYGGQPRALALSR